MKKSGKKGGQARGVFTHPRKTRKQRVGRIPSSHAKIQSGAVSAPQQRRIVRLFQRRQRSTHEAACGRNEADDEEQEASTGGGHEGGVDRHYCFQITNQNNRKVI